MDIFSVSKLGFGTSQIGGPSLINGKLKGAKPIPQSEAVGILKYAFDNGINFFDTSDKYGNAEELLGMAFSKMRSKVVIATKCGVTDTGLRDFSVPYINTCLENSLRRLKTDYIDIFQLAKPNVKEVTDELLVYFDKNIEEGKIRLFGISVFGNEDGELYLSQEAIKSFQIFYNLLFPECDDLIANCAESKRFVIIRSPLNSGILSGQYTKETKFCSFDSRSEIFRGKLLETRLECVEKIKKHFNLSKEQLLDFSLNFIFSNNNVNVVIPAASKIEQVQNYVRIYNEKNFFSEAQVSEIINFVHTEITLQERAQLA